MGPVFPIEVKKMFPHNDAKAGVKIGLVFSIATISDFLSAPLIAHELPRIGAKHVSGMGAFIVGCVMILFSFVSQLYDWNTFLAFCYSIRAVQGFGTAMVMVSNFAIITGTFPDNVASMTGMLEVFTGLGFMVGPVLSGVLYQYGGFKVPFLTLGGMLLLGMIVTRFILIDTTESEKTEKSFPITEIIRYPRVVLLLFTFFMSLVGITFFQPSLGVFLHKNFQLTPAQVGACFMLGSGSYMFFSPLAGYVADKYSGKAVIPLGCLIAAVGFELMGPHLLFGLKEHLGVALTGYALVGGGIAFSGVPVSGDILATMRENGITDSPEVHSAIGGMYAASMSLGITVGPLIGGSLTKEFNFQSAVAVFGFVFTGLCLVVTANTIVHRCSKKRSPPSGPPTDTTPLTEMGASK